MSTTSDRLTETVVYLDYPPVTQDGRQLSEFDDAYAVDLTAGDARALRALVTACERCADARCEMMVELNNNGETLDYDILYGIWAEATKDVDRALAAITTPPEQTP